MPEDTLEFFDASFLSELEDLAQAPGPGGARIGDLAAALDAQRSRFLERPASFPGEGPLDEDDFAVLSIPLVAERTNTLIEICRESAGGSAQSVEAFVVFFQALLPTLPPEGAGQIQRLFFRLVPTLIQIAHSDFGATEELRAEGRAALRNLETVLTEIASIRLAPSERELVFRSIDQMAAFIAVGEYAMASDLISTQLLGLIARNKLTRALYRIMEVEVTVQKYLKETMAYATPQVRLPEDLEYLDEYGPVRLFTETDLDGQAETFIQIQIPDMPNLSDVVLHLVEQQSRAAFDVRLDQLGTARLAVPPGWYDIGIVYDPPA